MQLHFHQSIRRIHRVQLGWLQVVPLESLGIPHSQPAQSPGDSLGVGELERTSKAENSSSGISRTAWNFASSLLDGIKGVHPVTTLVDNCHVVVQPRILSCGSWLSTEPSVRKTAERIRTQLRHVWLHHRLLATSMTRSNSTGASCANPRDPCGSGVRIDSLLSMLQLDSCRGRSSATGQCSWGSSPGHCAEALERPLLQDSSEMESLWQSQLSGRGILKFARMMVTVACLLRLPSVYLIAYYLRLTIRMESGRIQIAFKLFLSKLGSQTCGSTLKVWEAQRRGGDICFAFGDEAPVLGECC